MPVSKTIRTLGVIELLPLHEVDMARFQGICVV